MTSNDNSLSTRFSAAICALLFSSIMVLSAVGPARAEATVPAFAAHTTLPTAYLA